MSDWVGRTATEIAAAVRAGDATAHEVTRAHLDRISAIDGELGAFVRVRADAALDEAAAIDARADRAELPLAGVPIGIKDNVPVAGEPMRRGSAATPDVPQENDHPLVGRLRAAGAVIVGSTNLPELGLYPFTDNVYGMARNPWDTGRTAGGSSGGAAAAVAAGMVPIAHGNDGGGSLRIPAACCGLVGLKPSRGRISRGPDLGDSYLGVDGVLTRPIVETALLLEGRAGYEPGEATWAPRPAEPYTLAMRRDPGRLRIAMTLENPLAVEADAEVVHAL